MSTSPADYAPRAGIGLKSAHVAEVLTHGAAVDFFEIHAENYMVHLAWSSHGGHWFNDLLPLPYDAATLNRVCDHIDQVQSRLGRRLLLENPSTYLEFSASTMSEAQFLLEAQRRSGCG